MLQYCTEFEDEDGRIVQYDFAHDLTKARADARRLSRKHTIAYVIACSELGDRVGGECYANGRKDHDDGVIVA